ncbi:VapC toxin family PIN domain ribonuclease [Ensifer sp. NM-2]|uniref:type II toxin-antitoxin system VapC family toxin n=1 Tax=Ensifer sp. NM-2 TaxID=2109730 RepID=UPI000D127B3C|nr:type II toxin-antitoxin system VapC family toxin [Ensifer sp. NM-2]PSS61940.1 VapC toxin family PIN domain ribonuclease [Ensifer sp. NM-2]
MITLDTNVLPGAPGPVPSPAVKAWLGDQPPTSVFTTAVTEAEIRYGIGLMPDGRRRQSLEAAIMPIFSEDLAGRILPFDSDAAAAYATLAIARRKAGRPISQFDAQIAAITLSRGAALATRNVADFEATGVVIINPWGYRS